MDLLVEELALAGGGELPYMIRVLCGGLVAQAGTEWGALVSVPLHPTRLVKDTRYQISREQEESSQRPKSMEMCRRAWHFERRRVPGRRVVVTYI
jgi:hypothetical protein